MMCRKAVIIVINPAKVVKQIEKDGFEINL